MRLLKAAAGLALAPTALCSLAAAAMTLGETASRSRAAAPFFLGFGGYVLFHFLLHRLTAVYVLGHELSHAVAAWMCGERVLGLSAGSDGGHVDLSRSSAWIALAPYVVPLYAVLAVLAYRVALFIVPGGLACGAGGRARWAFLAVVGAAMSFHVVQTAETLWRERQSDLDAAGGALFALPLIAMANALSLLLAVKCLFPAEVSLGRALGSVWAMTSWFWGSAARLAASAARGLGGA